MNNPRCPVGPLVISHIIITQRLDALGDVFLLRAKYPSAWPLLLANFMRGPVGVRALELLGDGMMGLAARGLRVRPFIMR